MQRPRIAASKNYKWWAFMALAVGSFASVVDHGSVTVALPSIADHFRTDLPTTQWVVIGYALSISALLLPMGRLSDIVGRKRVYVAGFIIFVVGGTLAGSSTSVLALILSKVFQGFGAAMTQATSMAMVISAFSSSERGKALGLQLSVVGAGGVMGPGLGGFLISALGWRWVFFNSVLLGLVALALGLIILDGRRDAQGPGRGPTFDWLGAALSTGALVSFLLGLTAGSRIGWTSPIIVATMASFLGMLAAFVWWELHTSAPMMDLRLFKRRLFSLGMGAGFLSFLGSSSVRFLMPFYLQAVLGYSPARMGMIIVPMALSMSLTGPLGGRLSDRYGWRTFKVAGLMLSATGLFLLATVSERSPLGLVMAAMILQSSGIGLFNAPNNSSILSVVEQSKYGVVSGFLQLVRNSANVTSIALVTVIVTATMASMGHPPSLAAVSEVGGEGIREAFTSGMRTAYLTMGSIMVVAVAASLFRGGERPVAVPVRAPER